MSQLNVKAIMAVTEWLKANKEKAESITASATRKAIISETGYKVGVRALNQIESGVGIVRKVSMLTSAATRNSAKDKITDWLKTNKTNAEKMTIPETIRAIFDGIGIKIGATTLRKLEHSIGGVERAVSNKMATKARKEDIKIIARALRTLFQKAGEPVPEDLDDVCNGR